MTHRFPGILIYIILFGGLLGVGGCTGYRPPSIQLVAVRLIEQTEEAAAFHFDLILENPNDEPIELREFRYVLSLDDTTVYVGRRAAGTTLHSETGNHISLPAVVRYDTMGWSSGSLPSVVEYRLTGELLYVTPGELAEILLDTGVRKPKVRFSQAGRLDLPVN